VAIPPTDTMTETWDPNVSGAGGRCPVPGGLSGRPRYPARSDRLQCLWRGGESVACCRGGLWLRPHRDPTATRGPATASTSSTREVRGDFYQQRKTRRVGTTLSSLGTNRLEYRFQLGDLLQLAQSWSVRELHVHHDVVSVWAGQRSGPASSPRLRPWPARAALADIHANDRAVSRHCAKPVRRRRTAPQRC